MERQLTLRVPIVLAERLDRTAMATRRKRSELVRMALEQFLDGMEGSRPGRPISLVRDLLGSLESGIPDLGERHREYLMRYVRRGRTPRP